MTIADTPRRAGPFNGNGVTTAFPFTFKVFSISEVALYLVDGSGNQNLLTSNYSVSLNPDQDATPGGTITYPNSGSPLAAPNQLTILGAAEYVQQASLSNVGNYRPEVVENEFDYVTILTQQLKEESGRSIKVSVNDENPTQALPPAAQRIDKLLGFDDTTGENPVVTTYTSTQVASAIAAAYAGSSGSVDAYTFLQSGVGAQGYSAQAKLRNWLEFTDFLTPAQKNDFYAGTLTYDLTDALQYMFDEGYRTKRNSLRMNGGGRALIRNVKMYCGQNFWGDGLTPYGIGITSDTSGLYNANSISSTIYQAANATAPVISFYPVKETIYDRIYGIQISNLEIVMNETATGTYEGIRFQDPAFNPAIPESAQPRQTICSSYTHVHDIFIRNSKGHGLWMPAAHGGVHLQRINSFFNAKAGVFIDAYGGLEALTLEDIDGDANLLGNLRIFNMGRTGAIGGSYTSYSNLSIKNLRGEQRTNPYYNISGDSIGTKNVLVFDQCQRGRVNINGLMHVSSVTGNAPDTTILITGQTAGYGPTIDAVGVIAMVEAAQGGDTAPILLNDTVNSNTILNGTNAFTYGADPGVVRAALGVSASSAAGPQIAYGRNGIRGWNDKSSSATQVAGSFPFDSISAETAPLDCKVWGWSADSTGQMVLRAQKDDGTAADPIISFARSLYNNTLVNIQKQTNFVQGFSTSGSAWNQNVSKLGIYYLWVDSSGRLRIKNSAPTSDTDGVVVGTQS